MWKRRRKREEEWGGRRKGGEGRRRRWIGGGGQRKKKRRRKQLTHAEFSWYSAHAGNKDIDSERSAQQDCSNEIGLAIWGVMRV
uniref:Uncharacterized protein n=1 Tax=Salix viminalis TaxID=40686 RepID=A0A6N2LXP8_SALVM